MEKTDNELISTFMQDCPKNYDFEVWYLNASYKESWDWLMPVVEKIESIEYKKYLYLIKGYSFIINGMCAEIIDIERYPIVKRQVGETKISAAYKAVVEFIKWYNENKTI